jgi:hypothetical protein
LWEIHGITNSLVIKLSTNSTSKGQARVYIAEESFRIGLNLGDLESSTEVQAGLLVLQPSDEGSLQTAFAASLVAVSSALWVGEGDAWWAGFA